MKPVEIVKIEKIVHGGQGLGVLADGRKVFVWNGLAGETVRVEIAKRKKSYAEGTAVEIIKPSPDRIGPKEHNYLATSPWQIMNFETENVWKQKITQELFTQAGVDLPKFTIQTDNRQYNYRNKMEYSFWGDDDGIHLALYNRGSHQKQIVSGSALALLTIDLAANAIVNELNNGDVRAGELKTLVVRSDLSGHTVASLCVKPKSFAKIKLPSELKGLRVYHSNPKSPASVRTALLYQVGDCNLIDTVQGVAFTYDVDSFFQVNVPVFEMAIKSMKEFVGDGQELVDMYSGVGSIGLSLAKNSVSLIESDIATSKMAKINAKNSNLNAKVILAPSEKCLDCIVDKNTVIFDPPRAGLHADILNRVLEVNPPKVIYLSCNPATQARDIAKLKGAYTIKHFELYNFFPRTPHIESLCILERV